MNNKEVAHLWANQSRPRATGSHFYFDGDTIYSYGAHFAIARHYKGVVLFTRSGRSNTTARHISITRSAASHLTRFAVIDPTTKPGRDDVKAYGEEVERLSMSAARARNPAFHLEMLESAVKQANAFCEHFGFATRFTMPGNIDELKAKAKLSAERERVATAKAQAKLEADEAEKITQWIAGEADCYVSSRIQHVYLRAKGENLETSKGARVPLGEAHKAYRFVRLQRVKGWRKNGEEFKVGDYHLDVVNEQGVVAGCHRITWAEIERFAVTQGWLAAA